MNSEKIGTKSELEQLGVQFDPMALVVWRDQVRVQLTAMELKIFSQLYQAAGKPLTRADILRQVWSSAADSTKKLDVHVHNLRKKLRKLGIEILCLGERGYALSTGPG